MQVVGPIEVGNAQRDIANSRLDAGADVLTVTGRMVVVPWRGPWRRLGSRWQ